MNNLNLNKILLCLAIVFCVLGVVAFEDPGEVFGLTGASWVALAIALIAGALLA